MPRIDLDFLCHRLFTNPGTRPGVIISYLACQCCHGQKPGGKWRICTDYTNLNKACLKDPYPLPSIHRLVDGASDCGLLSFMDAYSKYNQIRMHPRDEAKIAFITNMGTFCYKVMPFGLKKCGCHIPTTDEHDLQ
ncbi:hypothetical protein CR513_59449, partial [Mucuna pruriens]